MMHERIIEPRTEGTPQAPEAEFAGKSLADLEAAMTAFEQNDGLLKPATDPQGPVAFWFTAPKHGFTEMPRIENR